MAGACHVPTVLAASPSVACRAPSCCPPSPVPASRPPSASPTTARYSTPSFAPLKRLGRLKEACLRARQRRSVFLLLGLKGSRLGVMLDAPKGITSPWSVVSLLVSLLQYTRWAHALIPTCPQPVPYGQEACLRARQRRSVFLLLGLKGSRLGVMLDAPKGLPLRLHHHGPSSRSSCRFYSIQDGLTR
jgi:hypothetical protein